MCVGCVYSVYIYIYIYQPLSIHAHAHAHIHARVRDIHTLYETHVDDDTRALTCPTDVPDAAYSLPTVSNVVEIANNIVL